MKMLRLPVFLTAVFYLGGCSFLNFWGDEKKEPVMAGLSEPDRAAAVAAEKAAEEDGFDKNNVRSLSMEEMELKQAKLWNRVDELEEHIQRLRENVRVLEKGLTLGLLPEELRAGRLAKRKEVKKKVPKKKKLKTPEKVVPATVEKPKMTKEDMARYQKKLAEAHDLFQEGRYGRAVVAYSDLGKEFGNLLEGGMHRYWIGRCWFNLKEYQTSKQHFAEFISDFPSSPWVPRAKLDMARVNDKMGLRETAIRQYREITRDYPYEDAAEMAKMELSNMEKTF